MTEQIIQRSVSVLPLALLLLVATAAKPTDATARKHKSGRKGGHGKLAHNARAKHQRYARLSRRHKGRVQPALTAEQKDEIVQKIHDLAKATPGGDSLTASSAEIQSE